MGPDYTTLGVMIFVIILDCILVFANVFFLALFSDLETDNINPIDLCKQVNTWILPEMFAHGFLTLFLLFSDAWWLILLNLPLIAFNGYRYYTKSHLLDATQIFRDLSKETKILFVKLGFYMVCFCCYLFTLIRAALGYN